MEWYRRSSLYPSLSTSYKKLSQSSSILLGSGSGDGSGGGGGGGGGGSGGGGRGGGGFHFAQMKLNAIIVLEKYFQILSVLHNNFH